MKRAIKIFGLFLTAIILLSGCSKDDEDETIVGTWRTTYVSSDGYNMSISYIFKSNGEYSCSTSYRGDGLPTMQLETRGEYIFKNSSLSLIEKEYVFYDEIASSSIGKHEGKSNFYTWTFPAIVSGNTLVLSEYKHSALYMGEVSFKKWHQ